ncbi:Serine/threonine-protein kinase, variant 3 [Basidiobolus ranarum]|uniref:non-specific serine/threonine protein kinase n=1 Tax=Basidiobolus ranarum TaxID=34480 RepID=A0ABR2VXS6_9FUNG
MEAVGPYEIAQEIGRGSFATVYKGKHKETGALVAIKSVLRSKLTRKLLESLESEISILKGIHHPNIVGLVDCVKSDSHIHLVMEYCSMGDLSNLIKKRKDIQEAEGPAGGLNENIVKHFLRQLASALQFLRSRNLIHRDIKPQNLLLVPHAEQKKAFIDLDHLPILKIADFGFARSLPAHTLADTLCGSPLYMAPEILRYEKYDAKADLWSVGAVLYELAIGKPPFRAQNHVELLKRIEKCNDNIKFPGDDTDKLKSPSPYLNSSYRKTPLISEELKDLIRRLLKRNPTERLSFEDFFVHPYITGAPRNLDLSLGVGNAGIPKYLSSNRRSASFDLPHGRYATLDHGLRRPSYEISTERIPRTFSAGLIGSKPRVYDTRGDMKLDRSKIIDQRNSSLNEDYSGSPPGSLLLHPTAPDIKLNSSRVQPQKVVPYRFSARDSKGDKDQSVSSNKTEDEILFEREYVVIEKRAVEVNALADELAASPRITNRMVRNPPSQSSAVTPIPLPYRKSDSVVPYYYGVSNSPPIAFNKMEYNTAGSNSSLGVRDRSSSSSSGWASGATPSALAKAISTASARLLGRTGQSPPYRELSFSKGGISNYDPNTEEDSIIKEIENSAYKAHAVFHLANLKFLALTPPHPESTKDIESILNEEVSDKVGAEAFALYLKTLSLLQSGLDAAKKYWDNISRNRSGTKLTSPRLNDGTIDT